MKESVMIQKDYEFAKKRFEVALRRPDDDPYRKDIIKHWQDELTAIMISSLIHSPNEKNIIKHCQNELKEIMISSLTHSPK